VIADRTVSALACAVSPMNVVIGLVVGALNRVLFNRVKESNEEAPREPRLLGCLELATHERDANTERSG